MPAKRPAHPTHHLRRNTAFASKPGSNENRRLPRNKHRPGSHIQDSACRNTLRRLLRQALLHHSHHLTPFFQHLRRQMRDKGQVAAFQGFAADQ